MLNFFRTHNAVPFLPEINITDWTHYYTFPDNSRLSQFIYLISGSVKAQGLPVLELSIVCSTANPMPEEGAPDVYKIGLGGLVGDSYQANVYVTSDTNGLSNRLTTGAHYFIRALVKTQAGVGYSDPIEVNVCIRPTGLTNLTFFYSAIRESQSNELEHFYHSFEEAHQVMMDYLYSRFYVTFGGITCQVASASVGELVYYGAYDACHKLTNGYYILVFNKQIAEVKNHIIQKITQY